MGLVIGAALAGCGAPGQVASTVELSLELTAEHERAAHAVVRQQLLEAGVPTCELSGGCKGDRACSMRQATEARARAVVLITLAKGARGTTADVEAVELDGGKSLGAATYPVVARGTLSPELVSLAEKLRQLLEAAKPAPPAPVTTTTAPAPPSAAPASTVPPPTVEARAERLSPWVPVLGGVALAAAGAVTYSMAHSELKRLDQPFETEEQLRAAARSGQTLEAVGLAGLALGAVGLGAGAVLALWPEAPSGVAVVAAPGQVAVSLGGSWP